jgi:hypothetical protein
VGITFPKSTLIRAGDHQLTFKVSAVPLPLILKVANLSDNIGFGIMEFQESKLDEESHSFVAEKNLRTCFATQSHVS